MTSNVAADKPKPKFVRFSAATAAAPDWHRRFLVLLPRIERYARLRFGGIAREARDEMIQETIARALIGYVRLLELGREHVATPTPLARFAVAQVRSGRRVGASLNCRDVSSSYCRRRSGLVLDSLDQPEHGDGWREILVEDHHADPADVAAMRIDFAAWLATLPSRTRRLAERLATGETTSAAARWLGVSHGRISQLRAELRRTWATFQGEPAAAALP